MSSGEPVCPASETGHFSDQAMERQTPGGPPAAPNPRANARQGLRDLQL